MARKMTVAEFLERAIEISGKTQREIAREVGYDRPNVLSMMKKGITKVPINKAPEIARACGVDEKQFVRMIMYEYHPDIWRVIQDSLEFEMLSDEERRIIDEHRNIAESVPDEGDDVKLEA